MIQGGHGGIAASVDFGQIFCVNNRIGFDGSAVTLFQLSLLNLLVSAIRIVL